MSNLYPETFKEICESVLEEADGRAVQMDSVALGRDGSGNLYLTEPMHRNVVSWVAGMYTRIQLASSLWSFHHKRGKFLTIAANKESYNKSGVREVDKNSLYFIKSGETARYPLYEQTYEWWQHQQQWQTSSTATQPDSIIQAPGDEWIFYPKPSAAGTVHGSWFVEPFQLINADDKPCWDQRYNALIKWGVIRMYGAEFSKEGAYDKLMFRVNQEFPPLWEAFEKDYLPPMCGAASLF